MEFSDEIMKMLNIISSKESEVTKKGVYKIFYAPNIPEKSIQRFIKSFDNHIATTSIVAFMDVTVFGSSKSGIIFTNDGIYYKEYSTKAFYFNYKDIESITTEKNSTTHIYFKSTDIDKLVHKLKKLRAILVPVMSSRLGLQQN